MSEPSQASVEHDGRESSARTGEYVVVARRYRPQTFDELVGQQYVAQALAGAIAAQKVGHAYLFTGARGVGKTSAARILAKALNCVHGPSPMPCNECDICQAISAGNDVDVLEIDGASNRGIDEMRELRQNVNVRPSRARFKIYIIDEVHMLTKEAFNALLKTLEEPPEHVKFIFCTTEPEKIPITILSRCQRFDFPGIQTHSIAKRLEQIVRSEGVEAEPEALAVLARRAAGSMRDAQSLLEQLLAFSGAKITLGDVHRMLGTAGDRRLGQLAFHLAERNAQAALTEFDAALGEGVDVGPLLDQLLGYFRDLMVAAVGCPADSLLYCSPSEAETVLAAGRRLGLENLLAIMQILDQTLGRLRYSSHGRILAELALVRICQLEDLEELAEVVGQLRAGLTGVEQRSPPPGVVQAASQRPAGSEPAKKKSASPERPTDELAMPAAPGRILSAETVQEVWTQVVAQTTGILSDHLRLAASVAISAPNRLVVSFPSAYTSCKLYCERPEQVAKLEQVLRAIVGSTARIEFEVLRSDPSEAARPAAARAASPRQRLMEKMNHPFVRKAVELFDAHPEGLEGSEN